MNDIPKTIDGANVIMFTKVNNDQHTKACRHTKAGNEIGAVQGLAICKYDESCDFYLFGCDSTWKTVTDTCHSSIEEVINQAEFEYKGTQKTWIKK